MKANLYSIALVALCIQGTITPCIANEWPISKPDSVRPGHLVNSLRLNTAENKRLLFMERTYQNFDPTLLSENDTEVKMLVVAGTTGDDRIKVVSSNLASPKDVFYCEQAIYDNFSRINFPIEITFSRKSKGTKSMPELKSNDDQSVKVHLVPYYILERVGHLLEEDIQAPSNVESISLNQVNKKLLAHFRSFWTNYLANHKHPTRDDIAAQQKMMRQEFEELFLPHHK